jgi:hypothetical protein
MRSMSEASGASGPQITISELGRKAGAKNSSPWMWSTCRWVSRMLIRAPSWVSVSPRLRMPVPASSTMMVPSLSVTWTQEVLPP